MTFSTEDLQELYTILEKTHELQMLVAWLSRTTIGMPDFRLTVTPAQAARIANLLEGRVGVDSSGNPLPVTAKRAIAWVKAHVRSEIQLHDIVQTLVPQREEGA